MRWQTKKTDNAEFDAYPVWLCAARAQTNVWQTTWQGKGNNLRTSRGENLSTRHDRKNLQRQIETSRHKEKQGQRREKLIRKTCRQTATSDSAEFDAESKRVQSRTAQYEGQHGTDKGTILRRTSLKTTKLKQNDDRKAWGYVELSRRHGFRV